MAGGTKREPLGANYRRLWLAIGTSGLGDGIRETVIPLYAASLTRDPFTVSLVSLAGGLPWLLFSLFSGALVDRLDRKRVMWRVDAVRAAIMAALAVAVLTGAARIPTLMAVAFAIGTGETLFQNASLAILPTVVKKPQLEAANSRLYAVEIVSGQFIGPPLGSVLFAAMAALPFFVDAASFAIGAVLVLSMRGSFATEAEPREAGEARPSIWAEIAEGLKWLWHHRLLRTLAIMLGVWNLLSAATMAVFVLYSLEILHLRPAGYGVLLTGYAAGALVGTFVARRLSGKIGPGIALLGCIVLGVISALVLGLTSSAIVAGVMIALDGAAGTTWNILTISLRQAIIPDRLLGRVSSVYRLVGLGTMPIGALIGGLLASAFTLRVPYLVMAAGLAIMGIAAIPLINNRTIAAAKAEAGVHE
jgi:MFS family permease